MQSGRDHQRQVVLNMGKLLHINRSKYFTYKDHLQSLERVSAFLSVMKGVLFSEANRYA